MHLLNHNTKESCQKFFQSPKDLTPKEIKSSGWRKALKKQLCYYCKVIPAIAVFLQIMLYEDSKFHPKWVMILPQICHCILHAKHILIIFTCNILPDNARWHHCMKSPRFLTLDKCHLGKVLAADPLRQSGQRSSRKPGSLPTTCSKQRQKGSWRMMCPCWAEIALSIVAATSAAALLFMHHQKPANFLSPRHTS